MYRLSDKEKELMDKDPFELWKDFCKLSEHKLNIKLPQYLTWKILKEILIVNRLMDDELIKEHEFLKRKIINQKINNCWKYSDEIS